MTRQGKTSPRPSQPGGRQRCRQRARNTSTPPSGSTAPGRYAPGEALDLVKSLAHAGFDETVEMAVRLGIDPRKADQVVRGTVALPSGTGKPVRVAVFAAGPAAEEARARRRGRRRGRRPGGPGRRRLHGLRRGHRHPGADGPGRPAGPQARPPRPRCPTPRPARSRPMWARPSPSSRAAGSSTGPTPGLGAWCRFRSARSASAARSCSPTSGP